MEENDDKFHWLKNENHEEEAGFVMREVING